MRPRAILLGLAVVASTGCYRVTVVTGAPAAAQVVDQQWQQSFVFGLVAPPVIDAAPTCQQGVSSVMTERTFLNGLVGQLSFGIFTPMRAQVTCASGAVQR